MSNQICPNDSPLRALTKQYKNNVSHYSNYKSLSMLVKLMKEKKRKDYNNYNRLLLIISLGIFTNSRRWLG